MSYVRLIKRVVPAALLFLSIGPIRGAHAGLHLGLGSAVAKRGATLVDKSSAADARNATGFAVLATLPNCPSGPVYDTLPTDLSTIAGIDPLGHVNPSGHTFPSDHIYFYASTTSVAVHMAFAPADIHITDIASTEYLNASPVFTDYSIYFSPCREIKTYYAHIQALSPAVQSALANVSQNCSTYSTGGSNYYRCDTNVNIPLHSGDLVGYGATGAFDFGTYDYRFVPPAFANPARHTNTDQYYTVCPIDYFAPGPKAAMESLLGRFDGGFRRTTPPVCGQYNQDVAGSARGFWYYPGAPNIPEDPHLSLIFNNDYAPWETVSVGTSLPNQPTGFWTFIPVSTGTVNREFSQVTADGNIYCYDTFYDPIGQLNASKTFLIKMIDATTVRIESQLPTACGAGPWAFTSNAVDFKR